MVRGKLRRLPRQREAPPERWELAFRRFAKGAARMMFGGDPQELDGEETPMVLWMIWGSSYIVLVSV